MEVLAPQNMSKAEAFTMVRADSRCGKMPESACKRIENAARTSHMRQQKYDDSRDWHL